MTVRTLNYGNYGIFLITGHAGFFPSAVRIMSGTPASGAFRALLQSLRTPILGGPPPKPETPKPEALPRPLKGGAKK